MRISSMWETDRNEHMYRTAYETTRDLKLNLPPYFFVTSKKFPLFLLNSHVFRIFHAISMKLSEN